MCKVQENFMIKERVHPNFLYFSPNLFIIVMNEIMKVM